MATEPKPLVCIAASLMEVANGRFMVHGTGQTVVQSVIRHVYCIPFLLPGMNEPYAFDDLAGRLDGLVLPGGRANIEPHYFSGDPFPEDEPIDPGRDHTVLPLIRACIEQHVPVFGICRGIQEMNVAMGGALHYRVHLVDGKEDHRMPRHDNVTLEEVFCLRHNVALSGTLAEIAGAEEVLVNSLHGQGISRLADGFEAEAVSPDGLIEGIRLKEDPGFTVGVQWHAEWEPENHTLSRRLFELFGDVARKRARQRSDKPRQVMV